MVAGSGVMSLRERGIYQLPNGRTLIAKQNRLVAHSENERLSYEVNDDGRLLNEGRLTAWDITDVMDTGVTAEED